MFVAGICIALALQGTMISQGKGHSMRSVVDTRALVELRDLICSQALRLDTLKRNILVSYTLQAGFTYQGKLCGMEHTVVLYSRAALP
jgi:hypothetical protein